MNGIKTIKYNGVWALVFLLYALEPMMPAWYNSIYLFAIIPVMFVVSIISYPSYIKDDKMIRYYVLYFIFSLITILWAVDRQLSFEYLRFYFGNFLITYIFASFSTNKKYLIPICIYYFVYLSMCLLLGYLGYGFGSVDVGSERAGGAGLNANRFGYFVFIITYIIYYYGEKKSQKKVLKHLFLLMIPLSFYIALITASRQLLIIQVPYISYLLLRRYTSKIGFGSIVFFAVVAVFIIYLSDYVFSIYESSYLAERMETDVEDDTRTRLLRLGVQLGNENFFTGVGLSNYRHFSRGYISHCSYTEAYAEGGIIQLYLYVMIFVVFLKNQITRYKKTKDSNYMFFLMTGVFYMIFNLFYVFQSFGTIMAFIFIMESISKIRYYERTN